MPLTSDAGVVRSDAPVGRCATVGAGTTAGTGAYRLVAPSGIVSDQAVGAVWFIARSGLRRRVMSGLLLVALVALAGGIAMTALAAARRTDTAYSRLSRVTNEPDLIVTNEGGPSGFDPSIVAGAPGVVSAGIMSGFSLAELRSDGTVDLATAVAVLAPEDVTASYELGRPIILEGRRADPAAPGEINVTDRYRDAGHPIGSVLHMCLVDFAEVLADGGAVLDGTATHEEQQAFARDLCVVHDLRVVGVMRVGTGDVVLTESAEAEEFLMGTPALAANAGREPYFSFVFVDVADDADLDAFTETLLDRAPPGSGISVQATALRADVVSRTVEPYVQAFTLFAVVTALAAVGVLGPAVVRWSGAEDTDLAPLLALGLRPSQLRAVGAVRGAVLGVVATAGAVLLAALASGQFPIGIARQMEPDPGLRLDLVVLIGGGLAVLLLAALLGALAPSRPQLVRERLSRVAELVHASGVGPAPASGVRGLLSGDGRGTEAIRSLGGVAVALLFLVAALSYQAGLGRLLDTPERYGWTWDAVVDGSGEELAPELVAALEDDPRIEALSSGHRSSLLRDGAAVQVFAVEPRRGSAEPLIVEGRPPRGDREIALGGQALDRLDAAIGDELEFRGPTGDRLELTVVGRTLLPLTALGQDLSVAENGLIDIQLLDRLGGAVLDLAIVDLAPGVSAEDLGSSLEEQALVDGAQPAVTGPTFSADLRGYDSMRRTPLLLAGVLAVFGVGVLAHTVTGIARRRRGELAILRCLGFTSRDLRRSVRWNAVAIAAMCLAVAVPLGVAAGRTLWTTFADSIGVVDDPVTPTWAIAVVAVATVAVAVVLAVPPGRRASRVRPAAVLRSE